MVGGADEQHEEVARNAEILKVTLDAMDQGISVFDADLNVLVFNHRFLNILDFPADRFRTGDNFEAFIRYNAERGEYGPGDVEEQLQSRLALARTFEAHCFDRTRPNGTVIEIRGAPLPNGGFLTTYTDVTERRQTEKKALREALDAARAQLNAILETVSAGIGLFDRDDRLALFNSHYREVYPGLADVIRAGVSFEQILKTAAERGIVADAVGREEIWFEQRLALHRKPGRPIQQRQADGRWIQIDERRTTDGGIAAVFTDVSELKRHEEDLAAALREEAERTRANLTRYFSPNLANHLADHPDILTLSGERRDLSFLCTDLAEFVPLAESLDANLTVKVMNEYIGGLSRAVFDHGGTVHTVVGDAVYAMFGAPMEQADHAARAVACALSIDAFAQAFAREKNAQDIAIGVTRIGVNSGPAIVGNVGGERFFHYTAYGDAINTAARLENANKMLGTRICVSAETASRISRFAGRPIGTLIVKGKSKGIDCFEPLNGDERTSRSASSYMKAFHWLEYGNPQAVSAFATHVGRYGSDALATFHLKRLLAGATGTRIALLDTSE